MATLRATYFWNSESARASGSRLVRIWLLSRIQ